MKAGVISMGCPINQVDTEHALGLLADNHIEIVSDSHQADLIVINACMHTREDKQQAVNTIFKMYQTKEAHQKIVVMGCFAEHYSQEIMSDLPEVDACIPIDEYDHFGDIIGQLMHTDMSQETSLKDAPRLLTTRSYWSYVRIADGAIPFYTNCAFPSIRGDYHSRSIESIQHEVEQLIARGMKELVLVAPAITRYGSTADHPDARPLIRLLEHLLTYNELEFIRMYPMMIEDLTTDLIDFIAEHPRVTPFFDLPIFHTVPRLVEILNRHYTKETVQSKLDYIRSRIPHAIIHTAIVTGIPSETDEEFELLIRDLETLQFDVITIRHHEVDETSPYVKELDVSTPTVKQERRNRVQKLQRVISHRMAKRHIGQRSQAIITGFDPARKQYRGRNYAFTPGIPCGTLVINSSIPLRSGDVVTIEITSVVFQNMIATVVSDS